MENFSFLALAAEISDIKEEGITFEDKQLSWDTAADVQDVVKALEEQKVVHYLKLEGNTLGIEAAAAIGKALEKHPEFRKALWRNMFTRRLKTEIPIALKHLGDGLQVANAQLVVLDLSDNALGPNGMVGLEKLLRSTVCYTLQELRLNNCGLGIGGGRMLSQAILDCHSSSTAAGKPMQLKVFVAGRNRLENADAKWISKIFATLKTLQEITMPQNSIYHEGIKALAEGIKECKQLQVLNLNDNTITDVGANYLADALKETPHLRELNLGDCLLKTNGAYVLVEALECGQQLESVELGFNEIGADGGLLLVNALANKPHLKKLDLNGNEFGTEGRESINEAIKDWKNRSILQPLDEDQSAEEDNGDDNGTDEYDDGDDDDDDEDNEGVDEYLEDKRHEYSIQDNEENALDDGDDDDGDYTYGEEEEDEEEEAAYVTSQAFNTKNLDDNSIISNNISNVSTSNEADTTLSQKTNNTIYKSANELSKTEVFVLSQTPCSLEQFDALPQENLFDEFLKVFNNFKGDEYLLVLVFTALKCGHLSKISNAALEVAILLYRKTLEYAFETKQERRVVRYLLIQIGLLRSEEKFVTLYDLKACRFALIKSIKDYKIESEYIKNVLDAFLDLPAEEI